MNQHEPVVSDLTIERTQKALDDATSHLNPTSATGFNGWDGAVDFVAQTTQQVGSAHDFYTQNATVIKSVSDVMVADLSKKGVGDFLGEAKKVMEALDSLQQIHPFVGVAILAFKGIVTLEIKRRENDRKVGLVLGQASDMMIMLLQLKDTRDPAVVGPHGEIRGRLDRVLDGIKKDIEDCGNAIDKFYKSKFIVKFFRSPHWASEFLKICKSFTQRTEDLKLALNIRTMLRVDIAIDKLDKLMNMQSEREARFEKEVQRLEGRDKCLESDDKLLELLKIAEKQESRPQNKGHADAPSKDLNKPTSKAASTLDASLLHELRASFGSLLDENRVFFMFKLDKQTSDITDAIKDSETRIIWAFNSSFRRVKDQHLRYIWKEMKWTTSVKTQYFIAELHDYYMNHFSRLRHDAPYQQATSDVSSLALRVPSPTPTVSVTSDSEGEDHELPAGDPEYHRLPAVDPADKWFLKYMTVFYVPSLLEGFDSDANGLISVREVNAFTSAMPSGWSLPQALAYSAAGWRVDSQYYHRRIEQVLNSMVDAQTDVLPENRRCIVMYLNSYIIDDIKRLVRSIGELGSEDSDLDLAQLADRRRKAQEETLAGKLNIVKYEIDSADSIKLFGSGRIENFLLPVLYLVIRRHLQIVKLASTVILVDRELEYATQTIENILGAVSLRVEQLAESFRQQGTDPTARFTWYAHGLYKFWYSPELTTVDTEYWVDFGVDDTELEIIDPTALKLGPFSLGEGNPELDRPTKLVAIGPGQQPEDAKDEYIRLSCMNKLHNLRNFSLLDDIPPYLSPKDTERLDNLSKELPSSDVQLGDSLAELQMRGRLFGCGCDGCHSHIIDVLRRCVDCESDEYDLCADCESLPVSNYKNPGEHKPTHNLLVFRMSLPTSHYKRVRWYARNFLSACVPAPVSPEGSLTAQEAESETPSDGTELPHSTEATQVDVTSSSVDLRGGDENISGNSEVKFGGTAGTSVTNGNVYACAECGVKMKGIFYVCLTCEEAVAFCGDCAFRDEFQVATEHHPHKHWLIKIKGNIQDADGTTDEPVDDSDETSALAPLSSDSPADNLAAMVESRFAELDLRLSGLVTQVDQLVHSLAGLTGKAQPPVESVNGLVD